MFLHYAFVVGVLIFEKSLSENIKLEWSLGLPYPVSKVINSGTEQDLFCSIDNTDQQDSVLLQCPLRQGICMENCSPSEENLPISCTNMTKKNTIIYRYRIQVFKKSEGHWQCQYKSGISRAVQLSITNKPYISSLSATPNPVWKGSRTNVTCEVLPIPGISDIQFQRIFNNESSNIPNGYQEGSNKYGESLIIDSVTPGKDDSIQCSVYSNTGMVTTKLLKINILHFPQTLQLTSSASDDSFVVGSFISFRCSSDGGNPVPVLSLFRRRLQEEPERLIDTGVLLSKLDNGATFYCQVKEVAGVTSSMKSNEIKIKVRYPPDNIQLTEDPSGQIRESQIQQFVCLSKGGSEPPANVEWSMLDPFGKRVSKLDLETIIERLETYNSSRKILKESVQITILRNLNGYTISCSIFYDGKRALMQKKSIRVLYSPNTISLNSNPMGAIMKGTSVVLTCSTGTANPASKILWYKSKPGLKSDDVTSHSNTDLMPGNFSGVAVSSTLSVHDVTKGDHGTVYRCVVSHAYIHSDITKEYFLNVLYPPIVRIHSYPQPIEEGDQVFLNCRTNGGNPNNASIYRFQWRFCAINNTYKHPANSEISDQPPSDIRKYCSKYSQGSHLQQSATLNISSVSSRQMGWYSCLVHSPGGTTIGYSFINVLYAPILIKLSPDRVYGKTTSEITLKFEVLSNPVDIDVKWFFQAQKKPLASSMNDQLYETKLQHKTTMKKPLDMKPFGRFDSTVSENYTVSLFIKSVTYLDFGEYFCEVSNRLGKKWIQFELFPSNDITIPENSVSIQINGRKIIVQYEPPSMGHFTHLVLRICSLEGSRQCKDMHISNPLSGKASTTLQRSPSSFSYRILVYNGSSLLQVTNPIHKNIALPAGHWVEMSFEMMVAVIIGVVAIFVLLFVALITLILLKCKQNKSKQDVFVENNSIATSNSHRRQDYFLLNSSANTTLLKNGCHCFSNYPMELRSDNGSDHSAPSQGIYHPIMMRKKIRDNGEMSSIHSGGSCQSPDVVLTERTSIGSGNNQTFNGTTQFNSIGSSTPTKVTFLSGRLHSSDGQRQDLHLPEDFSMPPNVVYAAVDDGTNQTRLIPIATKNLHAEYPLYFQTVQKQYDSNPVYSVSLPQCIKPIQNDTYRENSSGTNTDSNQYSRTQDSSVVEVANS